MNAITEKTGNWIKPRLEFIFVEIFFWCAIAVTMFNVVYLNELKLSSSVIGILLGACALISFVAQPLWAWLSDRVGSSKTVFMLCLGASSACYLLLAFVRSAPAAAVILMIDIFFRCSGNSLLDVWIISKTSRENKVGYGSIRLWGSIGFAAAIFLFGRTVDLRSVRIIFPAYSAFMLLTILLCSRIEGNTIPMRPSGAGSARIGSLFRNYTYVTFLLFVFLLYIPNGPFLSFLPTFVQSVGGTKAQYGLMQSIKALTEVPFFLLGKRLLDRYGPVRLMILATVISLVQALAYALSQNVLEVSLALLLSGPSFSLFSVGMLHYIYSLSPDGMKTMAQTLVSTTAANISAMIGNSGGGMLIDRMNLKSLYWAGSLFIAVSLALFVLSIIFRNRLVKDHSEKRCAQ